MATKLNRRAMLAGLASLTASPWVRAQRPPMRFILPFLAGTGTDGVMRLALKQLSEDINQVIYIDNKPGADGILATQDLIKSSGDGTTLGLGNNSSLSGVAALKLKPPYDPATAVSCISLLGFYTVYLFVNSAIPAGTVQELVTYGRAHPGRLSCGSGHVTGRIAGTQLAQLGGFTMTEIRYKGEPALMPDLTTGRIDVTFATPSVLMPFVATGKLKVLATINPKRSSAFPAVPTMAEAGLTGFNTAGWAGIIGPRSLPAPARTRLSAAFSRVLQRADVQAAADAIQLALRPSGPQEFEGFLAKDIDSYRQIARKAKFELE